MHDDSAIAMPDASLKTLVAIYNLDIDRLKRDAVEARTAPLRGQAFCELAEVRRKVSMYQQELRRRQRMRMSDGDEVDARPDQFIVGPADVLATDLVKVDASHRAEIRETSTNDQRIGK